jgi:hypothetical protein
VELGTSPAARLRHETISILPKTRVVDCKQWGSALRIQLDAGDTVEVDHVLYATCYKVNLQPVDF